MQQCNYFSLHKIFNECNLIHSYAFFFIFILATIACNNPKQNTNIATPASKKPVQPEVFFIKNTVVGLLTTSQIKTHINNLPSKQYPISTSSKSDRSSIQSAGYYFTMPTFNMDNGLPLNTILSSYCDSKGFLWIGTDGAGACYFDGINFKSLVTNGEATAKHILCFFFDKQGNMFMGTNGFGFEINDGHINKSYGINEGLDDLIINGIYEDKNNCIWICGKHNVYTFQKNQFKKKYSNPQKPIYSSVLINNDLWIGIDGGLLKKINQNEMEDFHFENEITALTKTKDNKLLAIDSSGRIWQYKYKIKFDNG